MPHMLPQQQEKQFSKFIVIDKNIIASVDEVLTGARALKVLLPNTQQLLHVDKCVNCQPTRVDDVIVLKCHHYDNVNNKHNPTTLR